MHCNHFICHSCPDPNVQLRLENRELRAAITHYEAELIELRDKMKEERK